MPTLTRDHQQILGLLTTRGIVSSQESPVGHRQEPIHGLATAGRPVGSCPHPRPCPRDAIRPSKIHSWIVGSATRFLDDRGGRHRPDRDPVFSGQRHRPRRHRTDRELDDRRTALVSQPAPGTRLPGPPARAAPGFAESRLEPRAMGHRDNLVRGTPPARRAGRHRHRGPARGSPAAPRTTPPSSPTGSAWPGPPQARPMSSGPGWPTKRR